MPVTDPKVRRLRAQSGGFTRRGNLEAAGKTRRELELHQLEKHIRRVAGSAPPLTPEQAERLRSLLPPASGRTRDGGDLDDAA